MLSSVESNDFCEEFQRNDFKIDYGYQHNVYPYDSEIMSWLLIIGHKYWKIVSSGDLQTNGTLKLQTQSETSDWFGKEYKFAFSYPFRSGILTGLVRVIPSDYCNFAFH